MRATSPCSHGSPVPWLGKASELRLEKTQERAPGVTVIKKTLVRGPRTEGWIFKHLGVRRKGQGGRRTGK